MRTQCSHTIVYAPIKCRSPQHLGLPQVMIIGGDCHTALAALDVKLRDTVAEGRITRKQLQNDVFGVQACQLYSTWVHVIYSSYVAIYLSTYNN